jgi:transcriptional regulator with XRE-family HTH domain
MRRLQTWELVVIVMVIAAVAFTAYSIHKDRPRTAEDLGVIEPTSQYQLACLVLENAKALEAEDEGQPRPRSRETRQLAERNVRLASLITDWSAWREIRQLTADQLAEITGDQTGFATAVTIAEWEQRLHPDGRDLATLDEEWMSKLPRDIWGAEMGYSERDLFPSQPEENEKIRRRLAEARLSAEALVKEAEALKVVTGDPLPLWVARALEARAEADFQMLWEYRLGLPSGVERLELEAQCTKYLKLASGWDANNYDEKVVPDTPIALK